MIAQESQSQSPIQEGWPEHVYRLITFQPKKKYIYKNPTVKQLLKQIDPEEADLKRLLCYIWDKKQLRAIANSAFYKEFRNLAVSKLVLQKVNKYNWLKVKPKKITKITPEKIGVSKPSFENWVMNVLVKILSSAQIKYLEKKDWYADYMTDELQERAIKNT